MTDLTDECMDAYLASITSTSDGVDSSIKVKIAQVFEFIILASFDLISVDVSNVGKIRGASSILETVAKTGPTSVSL